MKVTRLDVATAEGCVTQYCDVISFQLVRRILNRNGDLFPSLYSGFSYLTICIESIC
jgi:hypothetical protein